MQEAESKACSKCKAFKPLTDFFARAKGSSDGRMSSCKQCKTQAIYQWRENNKDKWRDYVRARSKLPSVKAQRSEYHKRPEVAERRRVLDRTPEVRAKKNKWREANKEKLDFYYRDKNHRRRIAEKAGRLTPEDWDGVCKKYQYKCVYCGKKKKLTIDHEVPLASGGKHEVSNVVPACQSCNSKKRALNSVDFAQQFLGRLL